MPDFIRESNDLNQDPIYTRISTVEDYLNRYQNDLHDILIEDELLNAHFLRWLRVFHNNKRAKECFSRNPLEHLKRCEVEIDGSTYGTKDGDAEAILQKITENIHDPATKDQVFKIFADAGNLALFGVEPFKSETKLEIGRLQHIYKIKILNDGRVIVNVITEVRSLSKFKGNTLDFKKPVFTSIMTYCITPTKDKKAIITIERHEEVVELNELKAAKTKHQKAVLLELKKYCGFHPQSIKTPTCKYYRSFNEEDLRTLAADKENPGKDPFNANTKYNGLVFTSVENNPELEKTADENLSKYAVTVINNGTKLFGNLDSIRQFNCDPLMESALLHCLADKQKFLFGGISGLRNIFFQNLSSQSRVYIADHTIKLQIIIKMIEDEIYVTVNSEIDSFAYNKEEGFIKSDFPIHKTSVTYRLGWENKNVKVSIEDYQEVVEDVAPMIVQSKEMNKKRSAKSQNILMKYIPINNREQASLNKNNKILLSKSNNYAEEKVHKITEDEKANGITNNRVLKVKAGEMSHIEIIQESNEQSRKNKYEVIGRNSIQSVSDENISAIDSFEMNMNNYTSHLPPNRYSDTKHIEQLVLVIKSSMRNFIFGKKLIHTLADIQKMEENYIISHMNLVLSHFSLTQLVKIHKNLKKLFKLEHKNIYKKLILAIEELLGRNKISFRKFDPSSTKEQKLKIKQLVKEITSTSLLRFFRDHKTFIASVEELGQLAKNNEDAITIQLSKIDSSGLYKLQKKILQEYTQTPAMDLLKDIIVDILDERGIASKYILTNPALSSAKVEAPINPDAAQEPPEKPDTEKTTLNSESPNPMIQAG